MLTNWNTSGKMVNVAAETAKTSKKGSKNNEKTSSKKVKKVVDKHRKMWYPIKVAAETATHKQLNLDNKTVYSNPENSLRIFGTKPKHR